MIPQGHEVEVRIRNRLGMHARPAAQFVRCAARFACEVYVSRDGIEINGKSIMGVMMLAAEQGAVIRIRAEGEDAAKAVRELARLVEQGFHEDDEGRPIPDGGAGPES
ncbi:MAG TPA: HPr family phosphocarrier protein [Gemmatimonadota bacterium]|nr:HPr family phosphocarrier protein [Gemmatimonadota bacterium]